MKKPLKNKSVHWVNGMKVRSDHFVQMERYIDDRVRDAIAIAHSPFNYGLFSEPSGLSVTNGSDDHHVFISLRSCAGTTAGGFRIQIPWGDEDDEALRADAELIGGKDNYVVVRAHEERVPAGKVADEIPRRQSDSIPRYTLEMLTHDMVVADDRFLVVGKLPGGERVLSQEYVPPCATIGAYSKLVNILTELLGLYDGIMHDAAFIAARETEKMRKDNHLFECARCIALAAGTSRDALSLGYRDMPPFRIYESGLKLARTMQVMLNCLPEKGGRTLLCSELGLDAKKHGELEARLFDRNREFSNHDVMRSLHPLMDYIKYLGGTFRSLVAGKKRDFDNIR